MIPETLRSIRRSRRLCEGLLDVFNNDALCLMASVGHGTGLLPELLPATSAEIVARARIGSAACASGSGRWGPPQEHVG
jgi:hypothetical protein